MANSEIVEDWDPLGGPLSPKVASYRRSREAANVVGSYFNATDLLAEALQNAADAIDAHTDLDQDAPRKIELDFDAFSKYFSVADTGIGMSREALDIVFQPNVTLKAGPLAPVSSRSWRGEKGVGLSFLLFSCDELRIRTCDGESRYDAKIVGAASWAGSPGSASPIEPELRISDADTHLGSERYTVITLSKIDVERFDSNLFEMTFDQLEWTLQTRTAVGNTACLFEELDPPPAQNIQVTVQYSHYLDGEESTHTVPYRYATPEDLLDRAAKLKVIEPIRVYDYQELEGLGTEELRQKLDGSAVRYVAAYESPSGHQVTIYMFAMAGDEMHDILEAMAAHRDVSWAPEEWQGFWVATRDMPTGVALRPGVLPTRGYELRMFGLLQWDDLKLDVGRKSLHGQTIAMFRRIIKAAWKDDLRWIVERIPSARRGRGAGALMVEQRARQARSLADLDDDIPFAKVPDRRSSVAAIFHELLGAGVAEVPELHGLTTGLFTDSDLLAVNGAGPQNGEGEPLHVVFGIDLGDLLKVFEDERNHAESVDLAVVWSLAETTSDVAERIEITELEDSAEEGATHTLYLGGLGGREDPLRVLVLGKVVEASEG